MLQSSMKMKDSSVQTKGLFECRRCKSNNLRLRKFIQWGRITGKKFVIYARCSDCGFGYYMEKTRLTYVATQHLPWLVTKTTKKHLQEELTKDRKGIPTFLFGLRSK